MSKVKDALQFYIECARRRANRVKKGARLVNVLQEFSNLQDSQPSSHRCSYKAPETLLITQQKPKISPAMHEYCLVRSFSEKLEKKKHTHLKSFFAEKFRLVSVKLGDANRSLLLENPKKHLLNRKQDSSLPRFKSKQELFDLKLQDIDQDIQELLKDKTQTSAPLPESLSSSIAKLRISRKSSKNQSKFIQNIRQTTSNTHLRPSKTPTKSPNQSTLATPQYSTPKPHKFLLKPFAPF